MLLISLRVCGAKPVCVQRQRPAEAAFRCEQGKSACVRTQLHSCLLVNVRHDEQFRLLLGVHRLHKIGVDDEIRDVEAGFLVHL